MIIPLCHFRSYLKSGSFLKCGHTSDPHWVFKIIRVFINEFRLFVWRHINFSWSCLGRCECNRGSWKWTWRGGRRPTAWGSIFLTKAIIAVHEWRHENISIFDPLQPCCTKMFCGVIFGSLHWSFSCFLCRFCSTGICSDYTSSFHIRHSSLFLLFKSLEGPQRISSSFSTAQGRLNHRCLCL